MKILSAGILQNLSYLYDATGNIRTITDALASETQAFGYDDLNRLTSADVTGGPAPYDEAYTYNATTGNLLTKYGLTYTYSTTHPHAVSAFNGNTYSYDANGNQIQRVIGADTFDLAYDAENRLAEVKKNSVVMASFEYDGDGKQVKSTISGVSTLFVGAHYQVMDGVATKYYLVGGQRIAMRTGASLYYLLVDHLGSTSITTDASGNKISELGYSAWGETRYASGATPTAYRYTGQREEASFGLYFYQSRWYDPYINHFTQADSIIPGAGDPQAWDRYAYANNNPSRYTDPSGHKPCWATAKYSCHLSQEIVDREFAKYNDRDKPAVAAFFGSQGWSVSFGRGHRGGGFFTPPMSDYPRGLSGTILSGDNWWADGVSNADGFPGNFWYDYDPDAILWGVGLSGSEPGLYNTAGLEEIVMFSDLRRATFSYGGQGSSVGAGASATAYGGIVFNLKSPEAYRGPFGSAGFTISVLDVGLTASYFWDDTERPFSPGTTQGVAVGYAPGAQASVWWSSTVYSLTWHSYR